MSGPRWRAGCARARPSSVWSSGRGWCCWRRPGWAAGRSPARSAVRAAWSASGGCGSPRTALAGLADAPRSGKPRTYGEAADRRILALLDRPPPEGFARWTAPLLAKELGDVSDQYVWRFLRAQRIDLAGRKSWCLATDPEFAAKAADIVGLYLDAARPRDRARGRREAGDPGARAGAGLPQAAQWPLAPRPGPRIQAARHDHPVRRARGRDRPDQGQAHQAPPAGRVPRLHERGRGRLPRPGDPRRPRQPQDPQAQARSDGWPGTRTSTSTSPRPTPAGSTRSRSGSRSSPAAPSRAPASPRSPSCAPRSTPSSRPTTRPPRPSSGARPRSTPRASPHGSRI